MIACAPASQSALDRQEYAALAAKVSDVAEVGMSGGQTNIAVQRPNREYIVAIVLVREPQIVGLRPELAAG